MSVIFKTLKKLRRSSTQLEQKKAKTKRYNIYSFRRVLFSPAGVIVLAFFFFLSGIGALYGVRYLQTYFARRAKETVMVAGEREGPPKSVRVPVNKEKEIVAKKEAVIQQPVTPPAPAYTPVQAARPGRILTYSPPARKALPSKQKFRVVEHLPAEPTPSRPEQPLRARYLPPESEKRIERPSNKEIAPAAASVLSPVAVPSERGPMLTVGPSATGETPIKPSVAPRVRVAYKAKRLVRKSKVPVPAVVPVREELRGVRLPGEKAERTLPLKKSAITKGERIFRNNAEKAAKIGRLVSNLKKAISIGDRTRAEALIDELSLLKGEGNHYVLKLRAYWFMRQGDYDKAAELLSRVLKENKDDLEAGVNMAIIEIRANEITKAKKRLARLRDIYQENSLVRDLLQMTREQQ